MHGVKVLLEQGYCAQVVIIPDGGLAVHRIVQKEKGIIWIRLEAQGAAAHGSRPWEGINAIERLMEALRNIKTLFADPHTNHPDDHWVPTINIGHIEGGQSVNKVPSNAAATCDIRYTEQTNPNGLLEDIRALLPSHVTMEVRFFEPMTNVDLTHPLVTTFFDIVREHGHTLEILLRRANVSVNIQLPSTAAGPNQSHKQHVQPTHQIDRHYIKKVPRNPVPRLGITRAGQGWAGRSITERPYAALQECS
jgi:acetylornithine deacetylase/succinyl-diaminopimelate desuccinylase-like protein